VGAKKKRKSLNGPPEDFVPMSEAKMREFSERMRPLVHLIDLRKMLDEARTRPGFTLEHERLALEAIHVAREHNDPELAKLDEICRRILDRHWRQVMVVDKETGSTWPSDIPSTLSTAPGRRLARRSPPLLPARHS
jgi:hypothetical protein